jgi:hypothetical protein
MPAMPVMVLRADGIYRALRFNRCDGVLSIRLSTHLAAGGRALERGLGAQATMDCLRPRSLEIGLTAVSLCGELG